MFEPSGVASVSCWESDDSNAALTYNAADPAAAGWLVEREGAERVHCGGHTGLHLSSRDLVRVLVHLRHTTALLPADVRDAMFAGRLGWNRAPTTATAVPTRSTCGGTAATAPLAKAARSIPA